MPPCIGQLPTLHLSTHQPIYQPTNLPDIKFYNVNGRTICRIIVNGKHHIPVYLKKNPKVGKEYKAFFIRSQASARELKSEELSTYIASHWKGVKIED